MRLKTNRKSQRWLAIALSFTIRLRVCQMAKPFLSVSKPSQSSPVRGSGIERFFYLSEGTCVFGDTPHIGVGHSPITSAAERSAEYKQPDAVLRSYWRETSNAEKPCSDRLEIKATSLWSWNQGWATNMMRGVAVMLSSTFLHELLTYWYGYLRQSDRALVTCPARWTEREPTWWLWVVQDSPRKRTPCYRLLASKGMQRRKEDKHWCKAVSIDVRPLPIARTRTWRDVR